MVKLRLKTPKTILGVGKLHFFSTGRDLIFAGDEFDEADFSVAHQEHPDEVSLDAYNALEGVQGQSSFNSKGQIPGPQTAPDRNVPQMRAPATQRQYMTTGSSLKPQISSKVTDSDTVMVTKSVEPRAGFIQGQQKAEALSIQQPGRKASDWQPVPALPVSHNASIDIAEASRSAPGSPRIRGNSQRAEAIPHNTPPTMSLGSAEYELPIGFFAARAAESVQNITGLPLKAAAFNPHLESPSIRKTAGVDHTKTLPVGKDTFAASPVTMPPRSNFVNPQADKARRVGMPVGAASPLQNRNSYKPPQIKRPVEMNMAQQVVPPFPLFRCS